MKDVKNICEKLVMVRESIARAHKIKYNPAECHQEGGCTGSCPLREKETEYLAEKLYERNKSGLWVCLEDSGIDLEEIDPEADLGIAMEDFDQYMSLRSSILNTIAGKVYPID